MKTLILFLIIFSIKSYSKDFYEEMPDCFCQPFNKSSNPKDAINELGSYIDTCEINQLIDTEESYLENRCDFIADKHFHSSNGSANINKYVKIIHLSSYNNLFDVSFKEVHNNLRVDDISDKYLEVKQKLKSIEKYIGKIIFSSVHYHAYEVKFNNYISLDYIKDNFSDISEINYTYLEFHQNNVNSKNTDLFIFKNNQLIFKSNVKNLRVIDLLGNSKEIDYKPEIDISHLQRGVYILQFTYDNQIYNHKFLRE